MSDAQASAASEKLEPMNTPVFVPRMAWGFTPASCKQSQFNFSSVQLQFFSTQGTVAFRQVYEQQQNNPPKDQDLYVL